MLKIDHNFFRRIAYGYKMKWKVQGSGMNKLGEFIQRYRGTAWGDLLSVMAKFTPIACYVFLSLYCLIALFMRKEDIPSLAFLPFIYSYLVPLVPFLVLPAIQVIASLLYREKKFFWSGCAWIYLTFPIVMAIWRIFVDSGISQYFERPWRIQGWDIAFILICVWDLAIKSFLSASQGTSESEGATEWLSNLGAIAIISLGMQVAITIIPVGAALIFRGVFHLDVVQSSLIGLCLYYFSHAILMGEPIIKRLRDSMVSPSYRRRTQESIRFLHQRFSKLGIKEKAEGIDLPLQNRSSPESTGRDDQG
jgi:hypothetical protein